MRTLVLLLGLAVAGCTTTSQDGQQTPNVITATATVPWYIGLKIPFCVGSVVIGSQVAAVASMARPWPPVPALYESDNTRDSAGDSLRDVNDGIVANCGPPYVVSP